MHYLIQHRSHKNCLRLKIMIIINDTVTLYKCYLNSSFFKQSKHTLANINKTCFTSTNLVEEMGI